MKCLFTTISILLIVSVYGQNFEILAPNTKGALYFEDHEGRIAALTIRNKSAQNGETSWNFNELAPTHDYTVSLSGNDSLNPSFLGNNLIDKPDGYSILYDAKTKEKYTICHTCKKGDVWTIKREPKIVGEVTAVVQEMVNGNLDSVKVISFSDKMEMRISKHNGLVSSPVFFPEYSGTALKQRGPVVLTIKEVYDMEIGDIFHWIAGKGYSHAKTINLILEKKIESDSVTYKVDRILEEGNEITHDTVEWKYPYTNKPVFSVLPGELMAQPDFGFPGHRVSYYLSYKNQDLNFADTAWNRLYANSSRWVGMHILREWHIKGCGISTNASPESQPNSNYGKTLVYYKKGAEVWGKGIVISRTCHCDPVSSSHPIIYPNIASQRINIVDKEEYGMATLQSLNGRVELIDLSNGKYNINHLAAGAYFITFKSGRREKFIVSR